MYGQRGWKIITSVLESLGLDYGSLSGFEEALWTDANGSANEWDNIQAVRQRLELSQQMTWYKKLKQSQEMPLKRAEFDPETLFLESVGSQYVNPQDLFLASAGSQHGAASAASAINRMVGGALVVPEKVAEFEAKQRGGDATNRATLLSLQNVAPETVVAMLHQNGIATHLYHHLALGHAAPLQLDKKQAALLDEVDTDRMLLCMRTPEGVDRYVTLRKTEGKWWAHEDALPTSTISPSAFLQAQGANDFTAIWPTHRLVKAVVPTTQVPSPAVFSPDTFKVTLNPTQMNNKWRQSAARQTETRHFGYEGKNGLMAIAEAACNPEGRIPVPDDKGEPIPGLYVNEAARLKDGAAIVYYRVDHTRSHLVVDVRLVPPSDSCNQASYRRLIVAAMLNSKKNGEGIVAEKTAAKTEESPRHGFKSAVVRKTLWHDHPEFKEHGYCAPHELNRLVCRCESGKALRTWQDGMQAVVVATPRGAATVLWHLEKGKTASVRFLPPGQSHDEFRVHLQKKSIGHGEKVAKGKSRAVLQRKEGLIPLKAFSARKIADRHCAALARMMGEPEGTVKASSVRTVLSYCSPSKNPIKEQLQSQKPGTFTVFAIPAATSGWPQDARVLCWKHEGTVKDLRPTEKSTEETLREMEDFVETFLNASEEVRKDANNRRKNRGRNRPGKAASEPQ